MAWYAYCITEQHAFNGVIRSRRPHLIENLRGINDCEVFAYPSGDFAVVVSEYNQPYDLMQKTVLEHARVVTECFKVTTVLPFRFGTIFECDEELRRAVRANRKAFLATVDRLRGKAEMHLKLIIRDGIVTTPDGPLPQKVGGEYLARLKERAARDRERQSKARTLSVQVHKLFNPLEEEVSCKKVDSGGVLIDIAHLIDHHHIEKYQNRYSIAMRQFKGCELSLSGPWPPYHFMPDKLRTVS
jgi:Gas vesicle synthesis protein GvpL/GvpF